MPRRGTRAYFSRTLQRYVDRVLERFLRTDRSFELFLPGYEKSKAEHEQRLADLKAEHERALREFKAELTGLRALLPPDVELVAWREARPSESGAVFFSFALNFDRVSTDALAQAVDQITPAPRGRPRGSRAPLPNVALLEKIHGAVEAGEGSMSAVVERFAKRAGVPAATLRKQYHRYRRELMS